MLVKCILNNIHLIQDPDFKERVSAEIKTPKGDLPLSINKEYIVYGIEFWHSPFPRYYICDDRYPKVNYPISYSADFFHISDNRTSKYWSFGIRKGTAGKIYPILSFAEWVTSQSFFEKLIDGDVETEKIFLKYKRLIDSEEIVPGTINGNRQDGGNK